MSPAAHQLSPYSENSLAYANSTTNAEDTIYPDATTNGNEAEMTITYIDENDISAGVVATTVVGVDLTYSSAESGNAYWTGNITSAEENTSGATGLSDDTTSSDSTDGASRPAKVASLAGASAALVALANAAGL